MAELCRLRDRVSDADIVELRLDSVSDPDVRAALAGRQQPVVVTCRPTWEGGGFQGSETDRRRILEEALELGADYVDIEWRAGFADLIAKHPGRIIVSRHDFDGVRDDSADRAREMRSSGAAFVKIAAKARRLSDCVALLDLSRTFGEHERAVLI